MGIKGYPYRYPIGISININLRVVDGETGSKNINNKEREESLWPDPGITEKLNKALNKTNYSGQKTPFAESKAENF